MKEMSHIHWTSHS